MPHSRSTLWWLAVLILVVGTVLAFVLWQDVSSPDAHRNGMLVMTIAGTLAGICIISATASWWLKR